MGSLSDLFRKYHYLIEDAFDLDEAGNLIEKNPAKVMESDDLFHELFVNRMSGVLKELAYDTERGYERPGARHPEIDDMPNMPPVGASSWIPSWLKGGQQDTKQPTSVSGQPQTSRPQPASQTNYGIPGQPTPNDPRGMIPIIRAAAIKYGHDPDVAVRVAQNEGLNKYTGDNGKSFGSFQLYTGGGIGNRYQQETGKDPSDPANEPHMIDYTMQHLGKDTWEPYHGAAKAGVGRNDGIGVSAPTQTAQGSTPTQPMQGGVHPGGTISQNGYYGANRPAYTGRSGAVSGHIHAGVDLAGPAGSPVNATQDGTVLPSSGYHNGYGNTVDIQFSDGRFERHAHLASPTVKPGDQITAGQQVGQIGPEGHNHYELHTHYDDKNPQNNYGRNTTVDPSGYLAGLNQPSSSGTQVAQNNNTRIAQNTPTPPPSTPASSNTPSGTPQPPPVTPPAPPATPAPQQAAVAPPDQTKTIQTSGVRKYLRSGDVKLNENRQRTAIGLLRPYK